MQRKRIYPAEMSTQALGELTVNVASQVGLKPIEGAKVVVRKTGVDTPEIEVLETDSSGQTETVELETPPVELSLEPTEQRPYEEYTVEVIVPEYEPVQVNAVQLLAEQTAIQGVRMIPQPEIATQQLRAIVIEPHTLYAEYPPKIPEEEVKTEVNDPGYIVLDEVVVPESVIVHDGAPSDASAQNYFVNFKEYIKNVASSEIYSTWPENTIIANLLAILSFTLNRVYTEWYRNKGYNFTITSSTAFDHKFIYGRNIYRNISEIVDTIFTNYCSKPGIKQPIFTQYCDGVRVQCPTWMRQWGSKADGDAGLRAVEILRKYYGQDLYINTAKVVTGIPASFPGYNLQQGSRGEPVRTIQRQLNAISDNFPAIPKIRVDGVFGTQTIDAVKKFQEVFYLPPNGIVDYPTWYKISDIFVAVTRLAEL